MVESISCSVAGCERTDIKARELCNPHYLKLRRYGTPTPPARTRLDWFMSRVDKNGPIARLKPELGRCWIWTGSKDDKGYGWLLTPEGPRRSTRAHRWLYRQMVSPVPDDRDLDHFACENHSCVRPTHVRPTTRRENTLRSETSLTAINLGKKHCPKGHPYIGDNLYIRPSNGSRHCKECNRQAQRARKRRKAAERKAAA